MIDLTLIRADLSKLLKPWLMIKAITEEHREVKSEYVTYQILWATNDLVVWDGVSGTLVRETQSTDWEIAALSGSYHMVTCPGNLNYPVPVTLVTGTDWPRPGLWGHSDSTISEHISTDYSNTDSIVPSHHHPCTSMLVMRCTYKHRCALFAHASGKLSQNEGCFWWFLHWSASLKARIN